MIKKINIETDAEIKLPNELNPPKIAIQMIIMQDI